MKTTISLALFRHSIVKLIPCIAVAMAAAVAPLGAMTSSSLPLPERGIVKLLPDYLRPRVYALNVGTGSTPGTLLALNATNGSVMAEISLGLNPTDMAMGPGGESLYVINTGSRTLMKVDLASFSVNATRSFTTPGTYNAANPLHIAVGRSNIVYFTDGAWAPLIYIYDFAAGAVIGEYNDGNGVGGLAATRDGTTLYTWRQFGWSAGNVNSWVTRLDARTSNALTPLETSFVSWRRDPFDTPLLLNAAETVVFNKQQMFSATNVSILLSSFSENIYAISLDGTVALGPTRLFNSYNGFVITNFPFASTVQSLSGDQRRLFRYLGQPSELHIYDMTELASVSGPSPQPQPANGEVVALPPTNLAWSPSPFALRYQVYFGTNATAVQNATPASPQYLGSVSSSSIPLNRPMAAGGTYYWRLDVADFSRTNAGPVWSFTISEIGVAPARVDVGAIAGFNPASVSLTLTSAAPRSWTARVGGASWLAVSPTNGTTPSALNLSFDSGGLPVGLHSNWVEVSSGVYTARVPVILDVRPLHITKMVADHQRPYIYALQPPPLSGQSGRLLFINTQTERIEGTLPIGENPVDLTIHYQENRLYVANWGRDETYVVDLATRTLLPSLRLGTDVYKINAGRAGRIFVEGYDQWITVSIIDTANGTNVGSLPWPQRQGDGEADPSGNVYYHSDDNISNAHIHKYQLTGDSATQVAASLEHPYGSRNLLLSPDGGRLFWRGYVYDADLNELGYLGAEVYATTFHGELAFTATRAFNARNGQAIYTLPASSTVMAVAGDQRKVFLYDEAQRRLRVIPMNEIADVPGPGLAPTPADGSVVGLPLQQLGWSISPFALNYRVFLGTNMGAVSTATTNSPLFLGSTTSNGLTLQPTLQHGLTYYWRVDAVGFGGATTGAVWRFTTAPVTVSPREFVVKGVVGLPILPQTLAVSGPGQSWTAAAEDSWVTLSASSGATPTNLVLSLNTTNLGAGTYSSAVLITSGGVTLRVPVSVELFTLAASKMIADPNRDYVYVLHYGSGNFDDAFLLFLNTATGVVEKVLPIGSRPTDMAINRFDDRLYVSNWQRNNTRVVDLQTQVELAPLQLGTDVYKINGGRAGRIFVEGFDQWITVSIIDTVRGTNVGSLPWPQRQGDGETDPSGNVYYHCDDNISNAHIHKYQITGDTATQVASSFEHPYGSRHLLLSPDGGRLFWRGYVYDANLNELGSLSAEIYACNRDGSIAFSEGRAYDTATRQGIFTLPATTSVMTVDRGDQRLWYFDSARGRIESIPLSIVRSPTITRQPADATVGVGAPVYMTVEATGYGPLTYQWQFNGANLTGATNFFFSIDAAQPNHDGQYRVVVANPYGQVTSAWARVSVLVPPSIVDGPDNISMPAGGTAVFTVSASGTAPFRYQWQIDGRTVPGATNQSLTLSNVQAVHAGAYSVIVNNAAGAVTSASAILRVLPAAPQIVNHPTNQIVSAGGAVLLSVTASGSAPFSFQWRLHGTNVPGAIGSVLSISNAQAIHAGPYDVVVANGVGSAISTVATVTVTPAAPQFLLHPSNTMVSAGMPLRLQGRARGTEPISYQWQFNNTNLPAPVFPELTISNASPSHSGTYRLVAANSVGSATSAVASVTITGAPPRFTEQPRGVKINAGQTLTFNVFVTGTLPISYQWYFQGASLPGETNRLLVRSNVTVSAAGTYFAVASNAFGRATSAMAQVTVAVPPTIVRGLANRVVEAGESLALTVEVQADAPLTYAWSFNGVPIAGSTSSNLLLANVEAENAGVYRVTAANQVGTVSSSMALTVFKAGTTVVAWGDDTGAQADVPSDLTNVVGLAGGDFHSLALRRDGRVVGWGVDEHGQATPPSQLSNVVAVAAGAAHSLALQLDGRVVAWGDDTYGQSMVPSNLTSVVRIAAGEAHSVALKQDGTVVVWGDGTYGQRDMTQMGFVTGIAAGRHHTLALRNNGTVIGWGLNSHGQRVVPSQLAGVKAVAAGYLHSLALLSNGTVVAWGDNSFGQLTVPAGLSNVVAISAGDIHSLAVRADGEVVVWGDNSLGQLAVPASLDGVLAASAGYYHNLALTTAPVLRYYSGSGPMVLQWNSGYVLQYSTNVFGPFVDIEAASGWTHQPSSNRQGFFRLRKANP